MHDVTIIRPHQLAILAKVTEDCCERYGVTGTERRETVARQVLAHFRAGNRSENKLKAALSQVYGAAAGAEPASMRASNKTFG